jgi:hypothetical protein
MQDTAITHERIEKTIEEQSSALKRQLESAAATLEETGDLLARFGLGKPGELTSSLGTYARSLSTYLETADSGALFRDIERLAREQPRPVMGASVLVGALAARIMRAQWLRHAQPLGIAFSAFALGFGVALLLPMTDVEATQLSTLAEKVQETGQATATR